MVMALTLETCPGEGVRQLVVRLRWVRGGTYVIDGRLRCNGLGQRVDHHMLEDYTYICVHLMSTLVRVQRVQVSYNSGVTCVSVVSCICENRCMFLTRSTRYF